MSTLSDSLAREYLSQKKWYRVVWWTCGLGFFLLLFLDALARGNHNVYAIAFSWGSIFIWLVVGLSLLDRQWKKTIPKLILRLMIMAVSMVCVVIAQFRFDPSDGYYSKEFVIFRGDVRDNPFWFNPFGDNKPWLLPKRLSLEVVTNNVSFELEVEPVVTSMRLVHLPTLVGWRIAMDRLAVNLKDNLKNNPFDTDMTAHTFVSQLQSVIWGSEFSWDGHGKFTF